MDALRFEPLTLTIEELARELRCSPRHVRRMVERGELPEPKRVGKLLRWPRAELVDWLAGGHASRRNGDGGARCKN
ncbi:MAG: helix-turn-helix domain-containing protein [Phycisphaerae bacterium]|nr:helix-turn-helix domain-containing protein [Phycisphaerae bacterium]